MLTVFVVAQPIAGMVAAKSLFRVVGTIVGASVALVLVGAFAQAGELFILALAIWIGACTFVAVLMRDAPGSYAAALSGYTAAIVGLPAALAPDVAFDTAVGRCIEILLGITCGTLISQVVFPQQAGEALQRTTDRTLRDATRWASEMLRGEGAHAIADRRALFTDVIALDTLRVFAQFDTPRVRAASNLARHLQGQLLRLLSILISFQDRVTLLRQLDLPRTDALQPLMSSVADCLDPL